MKHTRYSQSGFAIISVITIIAALIIGSSVAGIGFYVASQKSQEVEQLSSEVSAFKVHMTSPTATPEPSVSSSQIPSPDPSPEAPSIPAPTTQAQSAAVKGIASSAPTEVPVPQIVVEEYRKVFGRDPSTSDIDYWKGEYRKNGWSRAELNANLTTASKHEVERDDATLPTPSPDYSALTAIMERMNGNLDIYSQLKSECSGKLNETEDNFTNSLIFDQCVIKQSKLVDVIIADLRAALRVTNSPPQVTTINQQLLDRLTLERDQLQILQLRFVGR